MQLQIQIRIALCDDEAACHEKITRLLQKYKQAASLFSFTLSYFSSGKELLDFIDKHGGFSLYILDIIMPGINGIQLGTALRKRKDAGLIVYLTSSPDFALESYNTEALHYLLKPIDDSRFFSCMDKVVSHLKQSHKETISIKTPDSVRAVPIQDILYVERAGRRIRYYLVHNTIVNSITFSGTFPNAVAPLLAYNCFLAVGSSFAVNLHHVTEVTKSDLLLNEGHHVPIPRRTYKFVKSKWADYWFNKGDTHVI